MKHLLIITCMCLLYSGSSAQDCELPALSWNQYIGVYRLTGSSAPLFAIRNGDRKIGVIDLSGKIVVPAIYLSLGDVENDKVVGEIAKHKYELIDLRNGARRPVGYPLLSKELHDGTLLASLNGKTQLINVEGKVLIKPGIFDEILEAGCGLVPVVKNDLFGYANYSGKVVVPCKYANAETMVGNTGIVVLDTGEGQSYGVVDRNGNEVIPVSFERITRMPNFFRVKNSAGRFALFNTSGVQLTPFTFDAVFDAEGEDKVVGAYHGRQLLIDTMGKPVFNSSWMSLHKRTGASDPVSKGFWIAGDMKTSGAEKFGLIKTNGEVVLQPTFNQMGGLGKDYLFVSIDGHTLLGIIDYSGKQILPFEFEECLQQRGEGFVVKQNGKIGVVDNTGKTRIPFIYDSIEDDSEECVIVLGRTGKKTEYFDLSFVRKQ